MITMHARPRQTDRQTDEHHGIVATIRSMNASRAKNRTISKTVNPTNPKFEDKAQTSDHHLHLGYHYPKPNPTWLTAAILKNSYDVITLPRMIRIR